MTEKQQDSRETLVNGLIESTIRIAVLAIMVIWCFKIIEPFVPLVMWGGILAIALFPLMKMISRKFGISEKITAFLISALLLAVVIVPMIYIGDSLIEGSGDIVEVYKEGKLAIPAPPEKVAEWPLVGEKIYTVWQQFSENSMAAAEKFKPQIQSVGKWLLSASANAGFMTLFFIASIILAGFFMVAAESTRSFFDNIFCRFNREEGKDFVTLSVSTIRSVAQGVIGIAFIQAIFSMPAIFLMEVPFAGLRVVANLILAIVQLPILLVIGPIIFYVYSTGDSTSATIFTVYMLIVAFSESVLKPMLLGRGLDVPMLVILLGAIGGMLLSGIIGLFTGATILALGYTLFTAWLKGNVEQQAEQASGQPADAE